MDRVGLVEVSEFLGSPERQNVGQTVTWRFIEAPPLATGADHVVGANPVRRSQARFQTMTRR